MQAFFEFLGSSGYSTLFVTVGLAVWLGRQTVAGYGLGMVASAIVVGCALSVWASAYGVELQLDNFTRLLFYYLFMYGVGLRVGPSFVNSLGADGIKYTFPAVVSCLIGLALVVLGARLFDLPVGAAGGMLAGSQTMSAAIGSAEQAVLAGVVQPAAGGSPEDVSAMLALSYGITYIWSTVGIILITKYLRKWWGGRRAGRRPRLRAGARRGERRRAGALRLDRRRSARLPAGERGLGRPHHARIAAREPGVAVRQHRARRGGARRRGRPAAAARRRHRARRPARGDDREDGPDRPRGLRPHRPRPAARPRRDPGHQQGADQEDARGVAPAAGCRRHPGGGPRARRRADPDRRPDPPADDGHRHRGRAQGRGRQGRGGVRPGDTALDRDRSPDPLRRHDPGLPHRPDRVPGVRRQRRPRQRRRAPGLEGDRLLARLAAPLLRQHPARGALALEIFLVGFVACTIPPFVVWAIGFHVFKMNPAVLMGAVAGARSHSGPAREAAAEIQSNVPWIGFPVGYAVSGVLLTVFGYFAMVLAQ